MLRSVTCVRHYRDLHAGCRPRLYGCADVNEGPPRSDATFALHRQSQSFSRSHQSTRRRHRGARRSKNAESRLKSSARKLRTRANGFPISLFRSTVRSAPAADTYKRTRTPKTDERVFGTVNLHKFADKDNSHCPSAANRSLPSTRLHSASNGSSISYSHSEYIHERVRSAARVGERIEGIMRCRAAHTWT